MKKCDVCEKEIPEDFVNLLCVDCYNAQDKENERKKAEEEENLKMVDIARESPEIEVVQAPTIAQDESKSPEMTPTTRNGITDTNYTENPEMEDKNQVLANFAQFNKTGVMLWHVTRDMYEWIKNQGMERARSHPQFPKYVWKPTIVDVGCGSGVGSNLLSQEADFVWGIDKNQLSVNFAKECFTRVKNNIYYSSQVSFDQMDIVNETRELMKFDYVVAIEIIEHVYDYKKFLTQLITKFDKRDPRNLTEYFISTPNRANKHLGKDKPINAYHVREWRNSELLDVLSEFFTNVEMFNSLGVPIPKEEYQTTTHTPLLTRCSGPKI